MKMIAILSVFMLILNDLLMAQPALPSAPSQAPVDGGLSLLAAAGGIYAMKKLRDKNKRKELNDL